MEIRFVFKTELSLLTYCCQKKGRINLAFKYQHFYNIFFYFELIKKTNTYIILNITIHKKACYY